MNQDGPVAMERDDVPDDVNEVTGDLLDACIVVHREMGPGLLESIYADCLQLELTRRGRRCDRERTVPMTYRGDRLERRFRIDLVVDDCVLVELKSVDELSPVHEAQLLSYLRLSGLPVGVLVNFNVVRLVDGWHRRANTRSPEA